MLMSSASQRLLIFVAWPHVEPIILGQIAESILPADIFARYQRMSGRQVLMVSGSDLRRASSGRDAEQRERQRRLLAAKLGISFEMVPCERSEEW